MTNTGRLDAPNSGDPPPKRKRNRPVNLDVTFVLSHWAITLTVTGVACFQGGLQKRSPKKVCVVIIQANR